MAIRTRRHMRYLTERKEPLPEHAPEPKLRRINIRLSLSNARDRVLAQYLERDLTNGANISALIKRELWQYYKGIVPQGSTQQTEPKARTEQNADEPIAVKDNLDLARKLASALDDMEA